MKPKITAEEVLRILNEKYPLPDNFDLDLEINFDIIRLRSKMMKELEKDYEIDYVDDNAEEI